DGENSGERVRAVAELVLMMHPVDEDREEQRYEHGHADPRYPQARRPHGRVHATEKIDRRYRNHIRASARAFIVPTAAGRGLSSYAEWPATVGSVRTTITVGPFSLRASSSAARRSPSRSTRAACAPKPRAIAA